MGERIITKPFAGTLITRVELLFFKWDQVDGPTAETQARTAIDMIIEEISSLTSDFRVTVDTEAPDGCPMPEVLRRWWEQERQNTQDHR